MEKTHFSLAVAALSLSGLASSHAAVVGSGLNAYGQLTVLSSLSSATVSAIDAGHEHVVALLSDGSLVAWGNASDGRTTPPADANIVSIDAGRYHTLALTRDGRVIGFGFNGSGILNIPANLANGTSRAIDVSAGDYHSLALGADGTVYGWGSNNGGRATAPEGLAGVTAIAAGSNHSLALKNDGTVVAWGVNEAGQTDVPAGLNGVIAIAAGNQSSLALKSDGSVVGWGSTGSIPSGLSGVVSISAGVDHSVAIKSDGSLVSWGYLQSGAANLASSGSFTLAAAGGDFTVGVTSDGPMISSHPQSQTVLPSSSVALNVTASGADSYQWYFNGEAIEGATAATLTIPAATRYQAGRYSAAVSDGSSVVYSQEALVIVRALQKVSAPEMMANGMMKITFGDELGVPISYQSSDRFIVQYSHDLQNWQDSAATLYWNGGMMEIEAAASETATFYRVVEK